MSPTPPPFAATRKLLAQDPHRLLPMVQQFLQRIAEKSSLNAFVQVYGDEVQAQAKVIAQKIKQGTAGPLAGMVVGLKDLFAYKEHPLQASSRILAGFKAQFNATAVQRLLEADALIIGHQNCDAFGMGSSNENSIYGPVYHPLDPAKVPGGSSGGSAVSVQANLCHIALGTDTGGSVRQPAALCGIIGLKPTYSRISRWGVVAYASSFDTVGILAHHIKDCAAVLEVIAGQDTHDNTVSSLPVPKYGDGLKLQKKAKIAYLKPTLDHGSLQPAIKKQTCALLTQLQNAGHEVVGIEFPLLDYVLPTYYILTTAEASTNLARYDGVRYGYRSAQATTLSQLYKQTRTQGFSKEVQRRILLGTFVLSARYYDAYFVQAQKVRRLIQQALQNILSTYDWVVLPTTPTTAFAQGIKAKNPTTQYLADLYTVLASVAGLPAISLPNGRDPAGLPIGVQVIGNCFQEQDLLTFGQYLLDTHLPAGLP